MKDFAQSEIYFSQGSGILGLLITENTCSKIRSGIIDHLNQLFLLILGFLRVKIYKSYFQTNWLYNKFFVFQFNVIINA